MGLYNGVNTSVEAILTTLGRKYLSTDGTVNITKYALSDEEIDYSLYDETHPDGTDSFGVVLDNIIPLEASPTRQDFKSYLVDEGFGHNNRKMNVPPNPTLNENDIYRITPKSWEKSKDLGKKPTSLTGAITPIVELYKFTLENKKVVRLNRYTGETGDSWITSAEFRQSDSFIGREIEIRAFRINPGATTTITIEGMSSGLKKVIVVKVNESTDTSNTLSPFDENVVVTDTKYY